MKARNDSLDCLKGIAILLVMFGHVQVHNQMTDPWLYDVIKSLQMPLFFLISGYLAGSGTRIQTLEQYKEQMKKRATAYLFPFFSWLVVQHITCVPYALRVTLFQLDNGLWFLMVLFLFTWMAYTAQLVQAKTGHTWGFWLMFLGSSALVLLAYAAGVTFLSPFLLVTYLPYYTAAYFCGMYPELLRKWFPYGFRRAVAYAGGILFLAMAAVLDLVTVTGVLMLGVQTLASFLGCLAVIQMVLDWKGGRVKAWLARLGQYTLEIYVLHYQFATVLNRSGIVYAFWSPAGLLYSAAAFAAMSLITAFAIWIINQIPWFRLLLFGKRQDRRKKDCL